MKRLRVVGVTLAAIFTISAMAASAAQAGVWEAEEYSAKVTGSQLTQVTFTGVVGAWKCNVLTVQGELSKESSELNLAPNYESCNWAGLKATVNMEGCTYRFTAEKTVGESPNKVETPMAIICPAGKEIKLSLNIGECVIRFPGQTGLSAAVAENNAFSPMGVDLTLELKKITYTIEEAGLCPGSPKVGVYNDGTLSGSVRLSAKSVKTGSGINFTVT
jgi:hypothetical protein